MPFFHFSKKVFTVFSLSLFALQNVFSPRFSPGFSPGFPPGPQGFGYSWGPTAPRPTDPGTRGAPTCRRSGPGPKSLRAYEPQGSRAQGLQGPGAPGPKGPKGPRTQAPQVLKSLRAQKINPLHGRRRHHDLVFTKHVFRCKQM